MRGQEPLLPASLEELELLVTVEPPVWVGWAAVVVELVSVEPVAVEPVVVPEPELVVDVDGVDVVDVDVVDVVAGAVAVAWWLTANAVTPNNAAAPATVEPIATRMRVVSGRRGEVMHPPWRRRL